MIFDGKKLALEKEEKLRARVEELKKTGTVPKLVSILVGDNPESELYLALKEKFAQRIGVELIRKVFEKSVSSDEVISYIKALKSDKLAPYVRSVFVQLPLPDNLQDQEQAILKAIDPALDVDCLTPENLGLVMLGKPRFLPATVKAVMEIIRSGVKEVGSESGSGGEKWGEEKWLAGKKVCIVGASIVVGKPLSFLLSDAGATVTLCRSTTQNLSEFTRKADILISATGVAGLVKKEMVKPGAVVIDVGISRVEGTKKILGDIDPEVAEKASFFTPVPGGVGPLTVACLFENLLTGEVRTVRGELFANELVD